MDTVVLDFLYTKEEYVKASRQYLFMSKIISKLSLVLVPLICIYGAWYIRQNGITLYSMLLIAIVLFSSAAFGALYAFQPGYIYEHTEKLVQDYHLELSPRGIHFQTQTITSDLQWDTYKELWENEGFFYLIQGKQIYTVLPKRVFSPEQTELFRQMTGDAGLGYKWFK